MWCSFVNDVCFLDQVEGESRGGGGGGVPSGPMWCWVKSLMLIRRAGGGGGRTGLERSLSPKRCFLISCTDMRENVLLHLLPPDWLLVSPWHHLKKRLTTKRRRNLTKYTRLCPGAVTLEMSSEDDEETQTQRCLPFGPTAPPVAGTGIARRSPMAPGGWSSFGRKGGV